MGEPHEMMPQSRAAPVTRTLRDGHGQRAAYGERSAWRSRGKRPLEWARDPLWQVLGTISAPSL
jgi:hypothetical protein